LFTLSAFAKGCARLMQLVILPALTQEGRGAERREGPLLSSYVVRTAGFSLPPKEGPRRKAPQIDFFSLDYRDQRMLTSVTEEIDLSKPSDLVQGTLDMLLLKILALEPMNGFAVSQRLKQVSGDVLQVSDGSLYPALHKLEQEGWIAAEWKTSEKGRRAKYYSLTRMGRRQLEREANNWGRLSTAISRVVKLKEA
jgi:PadR family transcriptional regulator, regulatory protein PadR